MTHLDDTRHCPMCEDAAKKILELEQRVKVLLKGLNALNYTASENSPNARIVRELLRQTPQQTAAQIERWHIEWMMKLPVAARIDNMGFPKHVLDVQSISDWRSNNMECWKTLVAIPTLPKESKE